MTAALLSRVCGVVADVLHVSEGQITLESSPENVASWDSQRHLSLVLALEQMFGIQFEPDEIDRMIRVDRIVQVLESRLNQQA
jgi:acyl carrier protein